MTRPQRLPYEPLGWQLACPCIRRLRGLMLSASLALAAGAALSQTVGLSGMLGGKALLIVDGAAPKSVAAGESYKGVKVISTQGDNARVEVAGRQFSLRVGDAPASVGGGGGETGGNKLVLTAGSGGHFFSSGQINGRSVQFVVDTGATAIALSVADAQRIGLNYQGGTPTQISTANGMIPGWRLKAASVRVGDVVVYDVDTIVSAGNMPYVLLGNSFLSRFQMTRNNDQMTLEKRF